MTPCQGGCGRLVSKPGTCSPCRRLGDRSRKNSYQRGYNGRWHKESKLFLRANPVCVCEGKANGCNGLATVTDHKVPHKGNAALFWNATNWQPMSKVCHDRKTVMEDGGFGNTYPTTNERNDQDEQYLHPLLRPGLTPTASEEEVDSQDHGGPDSTGPLSPDTK